LAKRGWFQLTDIISQSSRNAELSNFKQDNDWLSGFSLTRLLSVVLLGTLLAACATTPGVPTQIPPVVEDRAVVDGHVLPLPEEPLIRVETIPGQQTSSPVVRGLLASALTQRNQGDDESSANSLERALRIEPRNAMLWSRLADVRFSLQDYRQAIQMAAKSNTLAGSDLYLRRQNWYLMANAYAASGDPENAQKYRDKLNR
jgi:tetratricopeptide (TPR) repeat protein